MGRRGEKAALELDRFFPELLPGISKETPSRIEKLVAAKPKGRGKQIDEPRKKVANE